MEFPEWNPVKYFLELFGRIHHVEFRDMESLIAKGTFRDEYN